MENVACNLCGSIKYRHVYSMPDLLFNMDEMFNVVECSQCGLGYVNPRPFITDMDKYYPEEFYDYFDCDVSKHNHFERYKRESSYLSFDADNERLMLDIGCANGDFPRYMKSLGWSVEGVEIAANSKVIDDFKVYHEEFSSIPLYEQRYDAITAWAVLEHVHDPKSYFIKAGKLLKPGGKFVFLVTNFKSISSRFLFREDVPRHLYFFTNETIQEYLSLAGMEIVSANYDDDIYSMRPVNWLRHFLYKHVLRHELTWEDIPANRIEFFKKHNLENSLFPNLKYLFSHSFTVIDRILMRVYEKFQISTNQYGIVTYVARRKKDG